MSRAIEVVNVSKQYRLGQIGTGSMAHDLNRWWHTVRGKEDPYLQIGEANDRTTRGSSEYVWSLRDVSFDIEQGDSVGIIGRNGAGKSTLLKILSRVTAPTTGSVKVKGRIASLLEVGTGFHPDLSGRDNIYLNGAILGMRKAEITRKFDEIVDFAGVERYIDTPVKRYSSGMYVRLAFAVAAHLESEILIVDEVLAVGDAEFQKKCLGKMNDVSKGEGRTVLFVSHSLDPIRKLCKKTVVLSAGKVHFNGQTDEGLESYRSLIKSTEKRIIDIPTDANKVYFKSISLNKNQGLLAFGDKLEITIELVSLITVENLELSFQIVNDDDIPIIYNWISTANELKEFVGRQGEFKFSVTIPNLKLYKGEYYFSFNLSDPKNKIIYQTVSPYSFFEVTMGDLKNEWGWRSDVCKYIEDINVNLL